MNRGEIYRTSVSTRERGNKPGFYVVVSRQFIADNDDVATVICAPLYSQILGISTEVVVGRDEGLPRTCAIRCDFLALMFKKKLTEYVSTIGSVKLRELGHALSVALDLTAAGRSDV